MINRLEKAIPSYELEERYQTGLVAMVDHIRVCSPDVVFYPGDSACRMAGELEETAARLGVVLPLGLKASHNLNKGLYLLNPLDVEDYLNRLFQPTQRILLADDCLEFGNKLQRYDQLFSWAKYLDVSYAVLVASKRYKFNHSGSPFHVLFHDEELFRHVRDKSLV